MTNIATGPFVVPVRCQFNDDSIRKTKNRAERRRVNTTFAACVGQVPLVGWSIESNGEGIGEMKKWILRVGVVLVIILGAFTVVPSLTRNQTTQAAATLDRVNPVVPEQTVYVSLHGAHVTAVQNAHGGLDYTYQFTSYTAGGTPRKLAVTVTDQPISGHYLAMTIRGQSPQQWRAISPQAVPKAALADMR